MRDFLQYMRSFLGIQDVREPVSVSLKRPRERDLFQEDRENEPVEIKRYRTVRSYFPKIMPKQDEEEWTAPRHIFGRGDRRQSFTVPRPTCSSSPLPGDGDCFVPRSDLLRRLRAEARKENRSVREPSRPKKVPVINIDDDDDDDEDEDDDCEYVRVIEPRRERVSPRVVEKVKDDDVVDLSESEYDVVFVKRVESTPKTKLSVSKISDGNGDYYYKADKITKPRSASPGRSNGSSFLPRSSLLGKIYRPHKSGSVVKAKSFFRPSGFKASNLQKTIGASFRLDEKNSYRDLIANLKSSIDVRPKNFLPKRFKDLAAADFFSKPTLKRPVAGFVDLTDQSSDVPERQRASGPWERERSPEKIDVESFNRSKLEELEQNIILNDIKINSPARTTKPKEKMDVENRLGLSMRHRSVVRDDWLENLNRKYAELQLRKESEVEKIEEGVEIVEEPIELTAEQEAKIDAALRPHPQDQVLVEKFNMSIRRRDISTLSDLNWLNDEVINFYMNLIMERSQNNEKLPKVYCMNTFFLPRLMQTGHSGLKRWTKKVDIFSHQVMLVPVHLGIHWCMSIISFKNQTIKYYDSMGGKNMECCEALLKYLEDEKMDKKKEKFDKTNWKLECVKDIPQQMNGSDCGMFSCMFGEYISRGAPITFSQADMPYFRRKMVLEIIEGRLLT